MLLMLAYNVGMARLLIPEDFGVVGMAMVFTNLVTTLFSLGLGIAIIQNQKIGQDTYSTVFWISLFIGAFCAIFVFTLAGAAAGYYGEPQVKGILQALSSIFLITSVSSVPVGLLSKRLQFRRRAMATLSAMVLALPMGIVGAYLGFGYWSIIGANILLAFLNSVFVLRAARWMPSMVFRIEAIKPIFRFGLFNYLTTIGVYFVRNADLFIVGKFLGTEALGYYTIAVTLAMAPAQKIRNVVGLVVFPAFSTIQDERERVCKGLLQLTRMAAVLLVPVVVLVLVFANDIVTILYGVKWSQSIPVLKVLILLTLLRAMNELIQITLMSLGDARVVFLLFLGESVALGGLLLVGVGFGLIGIASAMCIGGAVGLSLRVTALRRATGMRVPDFVRGLAGPLILGFLALGVMVVGVPEGLRLHSPYTLVPVMALVLAIQWGLEWLILNDTEKADIRALLVRFRAGFGSI